MTKPILDDPEKIRAIDKSGMIDFCINATSHYRNAAEIAQKIQVNNPQPDSIIIVGMGGSAIGGELVKDWARDKLKIPIEINRDYHLPAYADKKTLVLVSSYSGDTEETLSAFLDALKRGCMIFCLTSGGAVLTAAKKHKVPYLQVPGNMPPRAALPYMLVPLLIYLQKAGLAKNVEEELGEAFALIEKISKENGIDTPMVENFAKNTANYMGDSAPCAYGFGVYRSVAQRFKQQFNENSKTVAKWEYFPELNHNEIVGWEGRGEQCRWFSVIFIRDKAEPIEIETRIETTKSIMERIGLITFDLEVQGECTLAKMLSTILVGDFLSVYLAVLRGTDPVPVLTINHLKETLKENGIRDKIISDLEKNTP
ncbi:MAG: bifunctional phosphoglucose/phosphomannose isomerase [Nitrososphaerota archaeon]|uniref:bifunctional phosphoglucose/phosphomannose isomerase n=1 Tax=Candidatus Bathycorpusculum sp. TaxID=2994959 RepID=UPI0028229BDA|nr:bifunctional phosphoglucose/phosphomannose isomerase [Candidatus Termitimicrobium sp.]MCL2431609.1 bifunctional phosphoglucose/phosphomannose isomerase [Candidatus Termitimicrobium sp.]MDR0493953.1 bifunctional phosphoglucose/phosphomannose isomerase [Nitrososphaerota archaeon]